jgi:NAD(P)H dehydrogenase (quinone)
MTPKRIYILNGHPAEKSLNRTLAESYAQAAQDAGHEVRLTHLHNISFDPDFGFGGYKVQKPLEAELEQVLTDIEWSQHMVLTTPMWWGGLPAKLKGLFDRAFLPGRAFNTRETNWMGMPTPHAFWANWQSDHDFRHAQFFHALGLSQCHAASVA